MEGTYTLPVLIALDSDKSKYQELINSVHQGESSIESLLNEFSNNNIIEKSKDLIYSYHSKSVESIYTLKTHALFPTLENINNYLMNRTN